MVNRIDIMRPLITRAQSSPASTGLSATSPAAHEADTLRAFRFNPWPKGFFILLLLLVSCNKKSQASQENKTDSISSTATNQILESDTIPEDIKKIWEVFRQTVVSNDTLALKKMVQFPLKTHGFMDSDPQPLITQDKFYQAFKKTPIEYIQTTTKLSNRVVGGFTEDWFRVSDYQFSKINGNWKLSLIYFDTRNN